MAGFTAHARANEPLDGLVWRVTGQGAAAIEQVLEANRGLAALGAHLPEGHPVLIPELAAAPAFATAELIQLWD
jgi:phage tail protein X